VSDSYSVKKLDSFFRNILDIEGFASCDPSLNGVQVDNDGEAVGKIAFAVDASLETFKRAKEAGAGLLFVHHGLFWGNPLRVCGVHRERLRFLLENNLALYAAHLPLDQHPELGNNAGLAKLLGLTNIEAFGTYHEKKIGYKGLFPQPATIDEAVKRIAFMDRPPLSVFPFGKKTNTSCAIISGGAAMEVREAIEEGIDLYITGEAAHSVYADCLEAGINVIAGGHYSTEVWGVRNVMERCANELHIDTVFIDLPTGL
jgi:dinuclear metal center YbgI/SA1388 family protein